MKCTKQNALRIFLLLLLTVLLVFSYSMPAWAEDGEGDGSGGGTGDGAGGNHVKVTGCSVSNGSVVPSTVTIVFRFTNNVVNIAVRDLNRGKFSLETADGASVGISVEMVDDQVDPDNRRLITVVPTAKLAPGSYRVTAYAGIGAKNGSYTSGNYTVEFTVEGEPPKTEPSDPDPPKTDPPKSESQPEAKPDSGSSAGKKKPSWVPGTGGVTGGGDGGGSGHNVDSPAPQEAPLSEIPQATPLSEMPRGQSQATAPDQSQETPATIPESVGGAGKVRAFHGNTETEPKAQDAASAESRDFAGETEVLDAQEAFGKRFAIWKLQLGKTGGSLQWMQKTAIFGKLMTAFVDDAGQADLQGSIGWSGYAGGVLWPTGISLFSVGAGMRVARFRKEVR